MAKTIAIRKGTSADLADIQRLNQAHYDYENAAGFFLDNSLDLGWTYSEAGTKFFQDHLDGDPSRVVFLATVDSRPVGYLIAHYASSVTRSQNPVAEIEIMFVEEAYRRQGTGRKLMETFKSWAREAGVARLRVSAFAGNAAAHEFYRANGFVDFEVTLEQALKSGT